MKNDIEKLTGAIEYIAERISMGNPLRYNHVIEILYPPNPKEFMECDTCRAKAGSPTLCQGCLHNRTLIEKLNH